MPVDTAPACASGVVQQYGIQQGPGPQKLSGEHEQGPVACPSPRGRGDSGPVHEELITIGELATRTRLSLKALRLYGDRGLLPPAEVDPRTGFRRYGLAQVERARRIALLRATGMPLACHWRGSRRCSIRAARNRCGYSPRTGENRSPRTRPAGPR
ncbi:MerR family transcriptional regulator [Streptomyces sp. SP18CM02]|uniref:MerR family transcriptional regulator n=1 Tax=Streptomyces sp. SP18CM02 TaxID=2758571 RepID=UPI00168BC75A|nr:MerR family transcriptional regulator [Streptomyces sp. SP18CM02]MBD3551038.1 MerR family transcriptional regulator [Streptomyces sp. SP18CM02]